MHFYDHYHDPNTHLQLTRQREDELLGTGKRREPRPGLEVTEVIRELRAVRQRLEALEAKVQRLHS